jgi:hypothetical protein
MDKIIRDTSRQEEKVLENVIHTSFAKHCPDRKLNAKLKPEDHVELKGLFMVIAVACMCDDVFETEEKQLGRFLTSWTEDPKLEIAFHSFATLLFGVAESEVRGC